MVEWYHRSSGAQAPRAPLCPSLPLEPRSYEGRLDGRMTLGALGCLTPMIATKSHTEDDARSRPVLTSRVVIWSLRWARSALVSASFSSALAALPSSMAMASSTLKVQHVKVKDVMCM